jgi:hydroxyacylglutathione hydrolase
MKGREQGNQLKNLLKGPMIKPILALKDNYIWAIINEAQQSVVIVDPGDAQPVLQFLSANHLSLEAIFITHHHWDHTNGIADLKSIYDVPVFASAKEKIHAATFPLNDNDEFGTAAYHFKVLAIPGHTLGHIAYYSPGIVFTGDTLFAAGCGKLFEGTAEQMHHSLLKLAALPDDTQVYCGHEYTLNNLHFANTVDPSNQSIVERISKVKEMRDQNLPSLPSTIAEEKATNVFLRCDQPAIIHAAEKYIGHTLHDPVEVFASLRKWKDTW